MLSGLLCMVTFLVREFIFLSAFQLLSGIFVHTKKMRLCFLSRVRNGPQHSKSTMFNQQNQSKHHESSQCYIVQIRSLAQYPTVPVNNDPQNVYLAYLVSFSVIFVVRVQL